MNTRAVKIAKKRAELFRACVGGTRKTAKERQRELVALMTKQIAAENRQDRKRRVA